MKAILMSDHAKWCALMMNGDKTVEIRKGTALYKATQKLIDEYGYADIYVYCTKDKSGDNNGNVIGRCFPPQVSLKVIGGSGKVIFKFRCYKVEEIKSRYFGFCYYYTDTLNLFGIEMLSCLEKKELFEYLKYNNGYAIYISDLEIFDKPKELNEFGVKYSPQSFCYVEVE